MDPRPRDNQMGVGPNSKEKKARQINPLQNKNKVFVSFSKIIYMHAQARREVFLLLSLRVPQLAPTHGQSV